MGLEEQLLLKAQAAEKENNWKEAVNFYKQLIKIRNQLEISVQYFVKLGKALFRAADISNSPEEFELLNSEAIDAYNRAKVYFTKEKNIAASLECEGEINNIKGYISNTQALAKERFKAAYDLYSQAAENYLKLADEEGYIRVLSIKALIGFHVSYRITNVLEFKRIYNENLTSIQKIFDYTVKTKNFEYISIFLLSFAFACVEFTVINDLRELGFKEGLPKVLLQYCKKLLEYIRFCKDDYSLALLYYSIGHTFSFNGFHYTDTGYEQKLGVEKGLEYLKKAISYSEHCRSKSQYINSVFWYDWWALFGGFIELMQNRILQDAKILMDYGNIYTNHYSLYKGFAFLLPSLMYNNLARRSFFTKKRRINYAELAIKNAKKALLMESTFNYLLHQQIIWSSATLLNLEESTKIKEKLITQMLFHADELNKLA